jgi:hypothetical protein
MRRGRAARRRARERKRLGFVRQSTGKASHGHGMGMTISCRGHEIHSDDRKQASKMACRGRIIEEER